MNSIMQQSDAVVFVDADNTLWDTDGVYAEAQSALLRSVEFKTGEVAPGNDRLAFVRSIDQAIAEQHHAGLRYPPRLLVRALSMALRGVSIEKAAKAAWTGGHELDLLVPSDVEDLEREFFQNLRKHPVLRDGVREGLHALRQASCTTYVLTEGSRDKALDLLGENELVNLVDRVIEGKKEVGLFRRILKLAGDPPLAFAIGDQLDRDISPAKDAGLMTIYFPSGFVPKWSPSEEKVRPDLRVTDFSAGTQWILSQIEAHRIRHLADTKN